MKIGIEWTELNDWNCVAAIEVNGTSYVLRYDCERRMWEMNDDMIALAGSWRFIILDILKLAVKQL